MKIHSSSPRSRGFTLIELLVVITIIVILAGLSMGGYGYITRKQADSQATIQISLLSKALEDYKLDNGAYPQATNASGDNNTNSLYTLLYWNAVKTPPDSGAKIYLADLDPNSKGQGWIDGTGPTAKIIDPWGKEYRYNTGSTSKNPDFDLASAGKDGTFGNADDIDNY